jgi:hypothetical protein
MEANNRRKPREGLCARNFRIAQQLIPPRICIPLARAYLTFCAARCLGAARLHSFLRSPTLAATGSTISPGRTRGSFAVSDTEAATYGIQQPRRRWTPGGGWVACGLSSIQPCDPTFAQEGAPAPVTLTCSDASCTDGNRLRLTSGEALSTYGQDGTTTKLLKGNSACSSQ